MDKGRHGSRQASQVVTQRSGEGPEGSSVEVAERTRLCGGAVECAVVGVDDGVRLQRAVAAGGREDNQLEMALSESPK